MAQYLKLFKTHEEYEEYKSEHPAPEPPEPPVIPPIPIPNHVITYEASSKLVEVTEPNYPGLYINSFDKKILAHEFNNGVGTILFEDAITYIGNSAFTYCYSLTSINIPSSVTSIGASAFMGCNRLTSIDIPSGVTSIGNYAFSSCSSLTSIDIPSGVTSIGYRAFNGCSSLTSVTVNATTPPILDNYTFNATNNCPIYVPSGSVDAYKAASGWSEYASRITAIV